MMPLLRDREPGLDVEVEVVAAGVSVPGERQGDGKRAEEDYGPSLPFSCRRTGVRGLGDSHGVRRKVCFAPAAMAVSLNGSVKVVRLYQ